MKTNIFRVAAILIVLAFILFLFACGGDSAQTNQPSGQSLSDIQNCRNSPCSSENESKAATKKKSCQNPVIIAEAFDQSGSMKWSGTSATTADDLKPLLELIADCGGEIGVTFVRSNSAKPIERFRADQPPPMADQPIQKTTEEDYEFADRLDQFEQQAAARDETIERNRRALQPQIDDYLKTLAPLMAQKPQGATDLWTVVNRLNVFLSESGDSWNPQPHRYLIIVSDGEDTVGKLKRTVSSDAVVIWVNANASDKTMKDFPFLRFESFSAAAREISAKEGVK